MLLLLNKHKTIKRPLAISQNIYCLRQAQLVQRARITFTFIYIFIVPIYAHLTQSLTKKANCPKYYSASLQAILH